jgi:hypothetical protein
MVTMKTERKHIRREKKYENTENKIKGIMEIK